MEKPYNFTKFIKKGADWKTSPPKQGCGIKI